MGGTIWDLLLTAGFPISWEKNPVTKPNPRLNLKDIQEAGNILFSSWIPVVNIQSMVNILQKWIKLQMSNI